MWMSFMAPLRMACSEWSAHVPLARRRQKLPAARIRCAHLGRGEVRHHEIGPAKNMWLQSAREDHIFDARRAVLSQMRLPMLMFGCSKSGQAAHGRLQLRNL